MTLRQKQSLFVHLAATLLLEAERQGYELTFGETYRPPETAALYARQGRGSRNSLHGLRLAIDLNLFRDGRYLTSSESHRSLGEWWERQHPLCRWGGRFVDEDGRPKPDGNHYSLEHEGRK